VNVLASERSESLATPPSSETADEDVHRDFGHTIDRARTEQMAVLAAARSSLDDYGRTQE
jgi:hypothetical protein